MPFAGWDQRSGRAGAIVHVLQRRITLPASAARVINQLLRNEGLWGQLELRRLLERRIQQSFIANVQYDNYPGNKRVTLQSFTIEILIASFRDKDWRVV